MRDDGVLRGAGVAVDVEQDHRHATYKAVAAQTVIHIFFTLAVQIGEAAA